MYIARIAEDKREQATKQHLEEVAELAGAWASKLNIKHTARLTALLHDMGKFSRAFVSYLRQKDKSKRGSVIHSTQGAKYIYESVQKRDFFSSLLAEMIAICIAGHHGRLPDGISPAGETPLSNRLRDSDKKLYYSEVWHNFNEATVFSNDIEQLFALCRKEIDDFIKRCKEECVNPAFMVHILTKYLFSCLIDADRYNAYCFESGLSAAQDSHAPPWSQLAARLEPHLAGKNAGIDTPIKQMRQAISQKCLKAAQRSQGVYRLAAPTGGGKTLSSLRFALAHAQKHNLDRIIYVIPYLSVLEQTADNIREALGIDKDNMTVLEHHSNLIPPDDDEKTEEIRLLTSRWDSPIIITTMVQFLESTYSEKSGKLRKLHHMAKAVLIFDEVQSLPDKCVHLFNEAINFLATFGGSTILLCTATQPPLESVERPIHLSEPPDLTPNMETPLQTPSRTRIVDSHIRHGYTDEELASFVLEKQEINGNCLVILNTKSDVAQLYTAIKDFMDKQGRSIKLLHLSTMMCPAHRLKVINSLKEDLDEHRQTPVICVSTQLVEAGVDFSFKCVIRALAGLDSIAQAAGRCNRHGEDPDGRDVYLVNPGKENLSKLPEIKHGRDITLRILDEAQMGQTDMDILSSATMNRFYEEYFHRRKNEMDYPAGADGSLYDLLSCNKKGEGACNNLGGKTLPALRQAFRTAGERFYVIEQSGTNILVPYGKGEELADLFQKAELKDKPRLLREMGQFSVSLYPYQILMLEQERALRMLDDGLLLLDKQYYDQERGICFEAKIEFLYV